MKIITEKTICDLCEKEMVGSVSVSEGLPTTVSISYEGWYRGTYTVRDICYECNEKILNFLRVNKMLTWNDGLKNKRG